jgi:hypothetical protein
MVLGGIYSILPCQYQCIYATMRGYILWDVRSWSHPMAPSSAIRSATKRLSVWRCQLPAVQRPGSKRGNCTNKHYAMHLRLSISRTKCHELCCYVRRSSRHEYDCSAILSRKHLQGWNKTPASLQDQASAQSPQGFIFVRTGWSFFAATRWISAEPGNFTWPSVCFTLNAW